MNYITSKNSAEESIDRMYTNLRADPANAIFGDAYLYRTIAIATREILDATLNCSDGDCSCLEHKELRCPVCGFDRE